MALLTSLLFGFCGGEHAIRLRSSAWIRPKSTLLAAPLRSAIRSGSWSSWARARGLSVGGPTDTPDATVHGRKHWTGLGPQVVRCSHRCHADPPAQARPTGLRVHLQWRWRLHRDRRRAFVKVSAVANVPVRRQRGSWAPTWASHSSSSFSVRKGLYTSPPDARSYNHAFSSFRPPFPRF